MPYLSASAVVIHYKEALYQVYARLPLHLLRRHAHSLLGLTHGQNRDFVVFFSNRYTNYSVCGPAPLQEPAGTGLQILVYNKAIV